MIVELKKIREMTMEKPVHVKIISQHFSTFVSYGILSDLCVDGFIKRKLSQGMVFYSWNFNVKLTPNDYDYLFAKSIKRRKKYHSNSKEKVSVVSEKEQNEIIFNQSEVNAPIEKIGGLIQEVNSNANPKIQELEDLVIAKEKEISALKETILQKEETIKELILKLNKPQENRQSSFRSVVKKSEQKQVKYLKLFGIKIYEKN